MYVKKTYGKTCKGRILCLMQFYKWRKSKQKFNYC